MIYALISAWLVTTVLMIYEQKIARIIIYLAIFSLLSSAVYLMLGSPDVAMAEAATSAFTTVFFIVCLEKYFSVPDSSATTRHGSLAIRVIKIILPAAFVIFLFGMFIYISPSDTAALHYLRVLYISRFMYDVGGENAVTAIYLGYRVYDTLFEALVLVISVVAVVHMSHSRKMLVRGGKHSEIERDGMAVFAIQIICPVMLLFGIYLIFNGHISPGGGFQGGLAIAAFFICRYMIYDVYDLPIRKLEKLEDFVFAGIILVAVVIIFFGLAEIAPPQVRAVFQTVYLVAMNALIGLKVTCGFIILFYRYIAVERK